MKMLKKIFGVATVYVAFGSMSLRADFGQDLRNICAWCGVDQYDGDAAEVQEKYEKLYSEFKKAVSEECKRLRAQKVLDLKDVKKPFCLATDGEAYIFTFSQKLWEHVKTYMAKTKDFIPHFKTDSVPLLKQSCQFVFVRRMCGLVHFCIRSFAGRFGSEKLFNEKDCDVNFDTATEILKPFCKEILCEKDIKDTVFKIFPPFKGFLEKKLRNVKDCVGFKENNNGWVNWNGLSGITESYAGMVKWLNECCGRISQIFSERWSKLTEVRREDFDAFLEGIGGNLEGVLKMRESVQQSEEERKKNIVAQIKFLLSGRDAICDWYDNVTKKLTSLEKETNYFVEHCSEPRRLRIELSEIARTFDGSDQFSLERFLEIKKTLDEENKYRSGIEAARKNVVDAEECLKQVVNDIGAAYENLSQKKFAVPKNQQEERKFMEYALNIEQCNAYLKAFFYLHTLFRNALREHVSLVVNLCEQNNKKVKGVQHLGLSTIKLTNDFDEDAAAPDEEAKFVSAIE